MAFFYDKKTLSAVDSERGLLIAGTKQDSYDLGALDYRNYLFSQDNLEIIFRVASFSIPHSDDYLQPHMLGYVSSKENEAKAPSNYKIILEDSLREGFTKAKISNGYPSTTEEEYQNFKDLIKEGFNIFKEVTESQEDFPGIKYNIEFAKNIADAAAKYPGKFPNFERLLKSSDRDKTLSQVRG